MLEIIVKIIYTYYLLIVFNTQQQYNGIVYIISNNN